MSYLSRIETERDELRSTVSQLLAGWNRMVDDLQQLKQEKAELESRIEEEKNVSAHWCAAFHVMAQERNALKTEAEDIAQLKFRIKKRDNHIETLRQQLEMVAKASKDNADDVVSATALVETLKEQLSDQRAANESLKKHYQKALSDLANCANENVALKTERDKYKATLDSLIDKWEIDKYHIETERQDD